jgi:hypothetical protein
MGYQAGSFCYATKLEAAEAQRWVLGHDSTLTLGGVQHLLQIFPEGDEESASLILRRKVTRMTDYVEVSNDQLVYVPPNCGASMDPERMADMLQLWAMFIIPIVLVWGGRKLYEFFDRTPHEAG